MVDIVKVLRQISELEWWSNCPIQNATDEELAYPPHVIWRHKTPTPALAEFLRIAVQSFPGKLRWELIITERNWVLQPARVREHMRANNMLGGLDAAADLKIIDPEFGKLANAELPLLAEHIAKAAAKLSAA